MVSMRPGEKPIDVFNLKNNLSMVPCSAQFVVHLHCSQNWLGCCSYSEASSAAAAGALAEGLL